MSIKFWIGAPGSGKSTCLLQEMIARADANEAQKFFVIVPEQFTMQTQKEITRLHPRGGILNIDVLAFDRLAGRVFEETGVKEREILSETGKRFLIKKIISEKKNELKFLGAQIDRPGNLELLKSILSELMLYGIDAQDLARSAEALSDTALGRKCAELSKLAAAFSEALKSRYMTIEEVPDYLAKSVAQSELIKDAVIAFDGFTGFTPVQMEALGKIMKIAAEVHVVATLPADADLSQPAGELDLFGMSRTMIQSLSAIAGKEGVSMLPPTRVDKALIGHAGRFAKAADLQFLADHLFFGDDAVYAEKPAAIRLFAAPSVQAEVAEVARRIAKLVREDAQIRYRDIAVLTGDFSRYENECKQVFSQMEIPYFIDEKQKLIHNPFIEYVRAALEVCAEDFSFDSIGRLLLTGFSPLSEREADTLIMYLSAFGIRGRKKWQARFVFTRKQDDPARMEEINEIKNKLLAPLLPLAEAFSQRGGTVREKTEALYRFLLACDCEQRLHDLALQHREAGRMGLAQSYTQVYAQLMRMLEKLVDLLGTEKISRADYRELLEAGLFDERIGIIPPGNDEVTIGDMERTRLLEPKVVFFLGMNEGVLPRVDTSGGMLSSRERDILRQTDICLKPSPKESILNHRFYTYLALTRPSQLLVMSYAALSAEGEALRPAYLVPQLRHLFPQLVTEVPPEDLREKIERPQTALADLALAFSDYARRDPLPAEMELSAWYGASDTYRQRMKALYRATAAHRSQDVIGKAVASALYGKRLVHSPTRLERFSACAFAHYAQYALRLEEAEEHVFRGVDIGNILHDALDRFAKSLDERHLDWATLDEQTRDQLATEAVRSSAISYNANILQESAQNAYEIDRMSRLLRTSVWALQEQLAVGDFQLAASELAFYADTADDSLRFLLPDGEEMILTGRIDRLDICRGESTDYLKIMDYKTGANPFDLNRVYHGLQLQLIIYLQAALSRMKRTGVPIVPAGIFYYRIQDPLADIAVDTQAASVRQAILKTMRASGLLLAEEDAVAHLDKTLSAEKTESEVYALGYTKTGEMTAASQAASAEAFDLLGRFTRKKAHELGTRIVGGEVACKPYAYEKRSACDFCPYKSLCGFDRKIPGYRYRTIRKKKQEELFAQMEQSLAGKKDR